jgi:hypothetical protein
LAEISLAQVKLCINAFFLSLYTSCFNKNVEIIN